MDYFICDFCFLVMGQGDLVYEINGKTACEFCASKMKKKSNGLFGSLFSSGNLFEDDGSFINDNGDRDF